MFKMFSIDIFIFSAFVQILAAQKYNVTIYTGPDYWAGTNAEVSLKLYGSKGVSAAMKIKTTKKHFEMKSIDHFEELDFGRDFGEIHSIKIGHDHTGINPAWELMKVYINNWYFPVYKWLDNKSTHSTYVQVDRKETHSCGKTLVARLIGGKIALPGQWPFLAQIRLPSTGKLHQCGGTLIHPQFVVTAAHCLKMFQIPSLYAIVLGEHTLSKPEGTEQQFVAAHIWIHPDWDEETFQNDVAVIKLDKPAILNDHVKLACLPKQDEKIAQGSNCFVAGWGKHRANGDSAMVMEYIQQKVGDHKQCRKKMAYAGPPTGVTKDMLCVNSPKSTSCHGDSGGPLLCPRANTGGNFCLQGVVSWGSPFCFHEDYTITTRVPLYEKWIESLVFARYVNAL